MSIKYDQNELKTSHYGDFPSQGSTHRVDLCTGVDPMSRSLWRRIETDCSVSLTCINNRGRPLGSILWVCQPKIACRSAPFDRD